MSNKEKKYTVQELRKMKRLSVYGCMLATGLSKSTWYRVENGQAVIFKDELEKIAKLASIKFEQLDITNLKVGERDCIDLRGQVP